MEVFTEPDNILGIFVFCIPVAIISIIYCVVGFFNDRHYQIRIKSDGLHYRSRTANILSPSFFTYTVTGISSYKETSRYFTVFGKIEWTQSGQTSYESKKVKIPKMFSNMHLLRDYLDENS